MTGRDPAQIAAADQLQAEARIGTKMLFEIFASIARTAPDLATAKRLAVESLQHVHEETPWIVEELINCLVESFAMLYRSKIS